MTNYEKYSDLFDVERERIEDLIYKGTLNSLRGIKNHIYNVYRDGSLINVYADPVYGVDIMIKHILSYYIIYCASRNIVPQIGF